MAVIERDVVLMGKDGENGTIDFPITRLGNLEDTADVKETPAAEDYLPIVDSEDGGQMKKAPLSVILDPLAAAQETAETALSAAQAAQEEAEGRATMAQVNAAIQAAVLDSWEGSY